MIGVFATFLHSRNTHLSGGVGSDVDLVQPRSHAVAGVDAEPQRAPVGAREGRRVDQALVVHADLLGVVNKSEKKTETHS